MIAARALAAGAMLLALAGCEIGRKETAQSGYRGTGMQQVRSDRLIERATPVMPVAFTLPADGGPTAGQSYRNVQVLGNVSTARFNHLMAQLTQWVAPPTQGCGYCHNPQNMASDEKYTKVVARKMIQMTQAINTRWAGHVGTTGVTCYTCHRGQPEPRYAWADQPPTRNANSIVGNKFGQNSPSPDVGYASLPNAVFEDYLSGKASPHIRVIPDRLHPGGPGAPGASLQRTEATFGLMIHFGQALGVNCTYCHNSRAPSDWSQSPAHRLVAYQGIEMTRDVNAQWISPLGGVFPAYRKGAMGDPYKVDCTTCHQGLAKPLNGVSLRSIAPSLWLAPAAVAVPAGSPPPPPPPATAAAAAGTQPVTVAKR